MRLLALSVGNTSLFGGVFTNGKISGVFRVPTGDFEKFGRVIPNAPVTHPSLDESESQRRVRDHPPELKSIRGAIDRAVICSVVPTLTPAIIQEIVGKYRAIPLQLTSSSNHGLEIGYHRPRTLGADRLAAALGARARFSRRHVIVVDCGTATTITALHRDGTLIGGAILPGLSLWPEMLSSRTAQLPRISLRSRPKVALGRSTQAGIAAGIFFGHAGAIRELVARVRTEAFGRAPALVVGTGGHAPLFAAEKLFDANEPALVLHGLRAFAEQHSAV